MRMAVEIAHEAGGKIDDSDIVLSGMGKPTGRQGATGAWREAFVSRPYGLYAGLGLVEGTVETSVTWNRWPALDAQVREALSEALKKVCGGGTVNCRFTHVYTDGPAPYYTYSGLYKPGMGSEEQAAIKRAASDAIMEAGGTITHHHAIGRQHRPWYDQQRPEPFAMALRATKLAVDPNGVLNPGVLIDH